MGTSIRSPFYRLQEELGATFMEEAGWFWTESFGDARAEHRAVREDLGIWDVSPLVKWEVRGPDALIAGQRLHAGDILGLDVGQVRYGPLCDAGGLMVDDGTVFKFAGDHLWLMTNGAEHAEHFAEVTAGLDVAIEPIGLELPHLGLLGPRSRDALAPLCSRDVTELRYYRFFPQPVTVAGVPCWVSRTGFGGEFGYELFCRPKDAEDLWTVVVKETAATPFGVEAVEILRIEAGLVILDYDYEAHTRSPFDFSFDRLVHLRGGDFTGKAALEAVAADPPRRFVTLRLETDELPEYGAAVTSSGAPAGVLTSPTNSPLFGPIGLAVLERAFAEDGRRLEVAMGDSTIPATVAPRPIYDTQRRRPRS